MDTQVAFTEFGLSTPLIESLQNIGFNQASPVQEITIGPILEGKDIFAQAETGSGKTGSFAIPIIEQILRARAEGTPDSLYIVLSPTRELAQQTDKVFTQIGTPLGINSVCLIGGENIEKQRELLKDKPTILVATPGRLCDLTKQKDIDIKNTKAIVFDEADRLFDMGFKKEIEFILSRVNDQRQLVMVSATSNLDVLRTAYKFRSHPVELKLNEDSLLVDHIDHSIAMVEAKEKMPLLVKTLRDHENAYALIFCNTQMQTHLVAEWLILMGFKAKPISGRLPQNKRTRLMEEFRNKEVTILVCTDVAARGLDIKDVNLVINYEMPIEAANYVHRIGRTGRAGKEGRAVSFCAHEDCQHLDAIYELIDSKIPKLRLKDDDFATDVIARPYIDSKTLKVVERAERGDRKDRKDRKDRGDRKERPERTERADRNAKPERELLPAYTPKSKLPFVKSEQTGDQRLFFITTTNKEDADRAAMGYFQILDQELLEATIEKQGGRKFFFFGPRKTTYKYVLKPIYKKLITPYISDILAMARLELNVNVSFKAPNILVNFSGHDERMLARNGFEMLKAFEQLIKVFLTQKIQLPGNVRLNVNLDSKASRSNEKSERRPPRSDRSDRSDRGPRNDRGDRGNNRSDRGDRPARRREMDPKEEQSLIDMTVKAKEEVLSGQKPVLLRPLKAYERRIVHKHLEGDQAVKSTSIGDGREKQIEISLR